MAREWTSAQLAAMNERDRTLLVSAAAGSGKTAVLTERIVRSLTDAEHPADISRMLVVTFTRAAAGELRQRIATALSSAIATNPANTHLSRQLMLLGGAAISTIDSFYADLVRRHFEEAGMPASFRMADENELLSLRRELMNAVVDRMYATTPDFSRISDVLCDLREESSLTDTLLEIYKSLSRYPQGIDILLDSAAQMQGDLTAPLETPWGKIIARELGELALCGQRLFARTLDCMQTSPPWLQKYGKIYGEILERCRQAREDLENGDYAALCHTVTAKFTHRAGNTKIAVQSALFEELREVCETFREHWAKVGAAIAIFGTDEIVQTAAESAELLTLLHATLQEFAKEYRGAKLAREVAEFPDVSRAAYRLLVSKDGTPTPLALEIGAGFDAIYIDEYQDVDAMQDATFRAIASPTNRFMVGDIKQSIYRFRGAQPAVFAEYRRTFPALESAGDSPEATVFMSDCFRCDQSVIDFSNAVSGDLFSADAESIGYTKEDDLRFSKKPPREDYVSPKCQVVLIERSQEKLAPGETNTAEAEWIAAEIDRLLCEEKKADGTPITPADIAILVRGTSVCETITKCLAARGIACNDTSHHIFFENPDVLCVYSLLAALDDPFRDVHLAAAMRSPFFGFTLDDLVRLRGGNAHALSLYESVRSADTEQLPAALASKLQVFLAQFSRWREKAAALPVDRLLRYLYRESAILSLAGQGKHEDGSAKRRRANLQRLYEYARTFEAGGFKGLYQFVRYVDSIMENKVKMPAPDGDANAVSLITIHHSKGLEFPVCFVANATSRMSTKDAQKALLSDEYLGAALRLPNAGPFSRANTFFREAIAREILRQNKQEEMRILYVAMTRARERLYVTGNPQYGTASLLHRTALAATYPEAAFLTANGPSYMDWVLSALFRRAYDRFAEIKIVEQDKLASAPASYAAGKQAAPLDAERLRAHFSFTYPYRHLTRLPAKLSVSHLSPGVLDVYDTDGVSPAALTDEDTEQLLHTFERVPRFGTEKREVLAAARGTATHEFLQFCDFARAERFGVDDELARLIEARFLPPEDRELIRKDELERFFKSDFYRTLKNGRELHRETRFHIFLPAAEFTKDETFGKELDGEQLAVQGVIDLFYRDAEGHLVLCDYKTDRLTPAEQRDPALAARTLGERHRRQLSYYAKALAQLMGEAPHRVLIYSLPLGEAVEITL